MQPEATPDRRTVVVAAVLGTAGLCALAACTSATSSTSSTSVSGSSGSSSDEGGSDDGSTSPSSGGSAGPRLVALDQVPVGGSVVVDGATGKVAVAQPMAGKVVGFTAICTHQGCTVAAAGTQLQCPCHGSVFDAFTGQVINGPAQAPLGAVQVSVSGQDVVAG
ncbi:MAG TPA: Rieske (2Fe-2S) protein [Kineosporiaceae bacterium]|nr:Rieske (2Fe-2S) protein [Kineosporiaceae bacterium]